MGGALHVVERYVQHVEPRAERAAAPQRAHRLRYRPHQLGHRLQGVGHLAGTGERMSREVRHAASERGRGAARPLECGADAMTHGAAQLRDLAYRLCRPGLGYLRRTTLTGGAARRGQVVFLARAFDESLRHPDHADTIGHDVMHLEDHAVTPLVETFDA